MNCPNRAQREHVDRRIPSPTWASIFYLRCDFCGRERTETPQERDERIHREINDKEN